MEVHPELKLEFEEPMVLILVRKLSKYSLRIVLSRPVLPRNKYCLLKNNTKATNAGEETCFIFSGTQLSHVFVLI